MSKQKMDRVSRTIAAIERLYQDLTADERREVERRLLECRWFGCDIKTGRTIDRIRAWWLERKHSQRSRKATPENQVRGEAQAKEKEEKSWEQLYMDHPDEEPEAVRSRVRRERKRRQT
jgi:hypothetical protein